MLTLTKPRLSLEKRTKDCPIDKVTMRVTISIVADAIRLIDGRSVPFDQDGWLPEGVYPTTIEEVRKVLGTTMGGEVRPNLMEKFESFFEEVRTIDYVVAIILNGSFVSLEPKPDDIDIIIVLSREIKDKGKLVPHEQNLLNRRYLEKNYKLDMLSGVKNEESLRSSLGWYLQRKVEYYVDNRFTKGVLLVTCSDKPINLESIL
jgi:predicted nucleotidyltransferase